MPYSKVARRMRLHPNCHAWLELPIARWGVRGRRVVLLTVLDGRRDLGELLIAGRYANATEPRGKHLPGPPVRLTTVCHGR